MDRPVTTTFQSYPTNYQTFTAQNKQTVLHVVTSFGRCRTTKLRQALGSGWTGHWYQATASSNPELETATHTFQNLRKCGLWTRNTATTNQMIILPWRICSCETAISAVSSGKMVLISNTSVALQHKWKRMTQERMKRGALLPALPISLVCQGNTHTNLHLSETSKLHSGAWYCSALAD